MAVNVLVDLVGRVIARPKYRQWKLGTLVNYQVRSVRYRVEGKGRHSLTGILTTNLLGKVDKTRITGCLN